ncbi:Xaa-Pro peptidase family protein [Fredinandcohnia sp. QZ13]|uniref:M24 family metallopeptidase n=1 Tax=Fredinandcohnia sp. QZ13 TaxID=3073144 RepID=UPI0028535BA3|nr:Xaa-Pro peptidase family protein [Fredinandcohnia sp. QZ13]MDR4889229.1 Xaa-Pro peptidase family protein [Fredinandcohnia sp. QZ13]
MNQRLQQLSSWLKEKDITCSFITSTPNVFYLTNFYTDPHERLLGLFVFQDEEPILICPNMELAQARNAGWQYEIIGFSDTDNPWELIQNSLSKRNVNVSTLALEKEHLTVERFEQIQKLFPSTSFVSAEEKLHTLRMIKEEQEVSILQEAAKLADYGVEVGVEAIAEGKTELDVLATIEFELKKKGIRQMSFDTMVLTGLKTAAPHGKPGLETIKKGDFVLFDLGVVLDGYCSDITRTVAVGEISDQQREVYNTVLKAQLAAVDACQPGTRVGDIDVAARSIISNAGYGEYFTHRIGHGLGIDVHEFPSMNETNDMLLQKGMVFTIEPGIYVPEIGGVRIEDDMIITTDGAKTLTNFPKELITK